MSKENLKREIAWETVEVVQNMQDFIKEHIFDEDFDKEAVYIIAGYSPRQCERLFHKLKGMSISEYIRAIRLTESSFCLLGNERKTVLEIALDSRFKSHEGYTKAFSKKFGITPDAYRKAPLAIPLFIQYPVRAYYSYLYQRENLKMNKELMLCMISVVDKPKRMLLLLRSLKAHDYWSFCEEMGCDWEGLFNSIPEKIDIAAILELPKCLQKSGFSRIAAGVELPINYTGKIPVNCELVELTEGKMLYFQSDSFEKDEEFGIAIDSVFRAIDKYNIESYGYEYAPKFNFGASTEMGAKMALPIRKI
jgi:AraC-like DNA-binding protein